MIDDHGPKVDGCWPLPAYAHRPGETQRPVDSPAFEVARRAPAKFSIANWHENEAYLYGFVLFRGCYYWEAHEVWEAVWRSCRPNSRERHLVQGLIQLANGELKGMLGRVQAQTRLLRLADGALREAVQGHAGSPDGGALLGVDIAALRAELAKVLGDCDGT